MFATITPFHCSARLEPVVAKVTGRVSVVPFQVTNPAAVLAELAVDTLDVPAARGVGFDAANTISPALNFIKTPAGEKPF